VSDAIIAVLFFLPGLAAIALAIGAYIIERRDTLSRRALLMLIVGFLAVTALQLYTVYKLIGQPDPNFFSVVCAKNPPSFLKGTQLDCGSER
jgi:formate-dependent nitrite reductase membrane component NrfD